MNLTPPEVTPAQIAIYDQLRAEMGAALARIRQQDPGPDVHPRARVERIVELTGAEIRQATHSCRCPGCITAVTIRLAVEAILQLPQEAGK